MQNNILLIVLFTFFINIKIATASPVEIVEPSKIKIEDIQNKRMNITGNILLITGSTVAVVGFIPIIHGLYWLDSPENYGIPKCEIIVGSGIELVSSVFIITGILFKKQSKLKLPINFKFSGNGICLIYNLGSVRHN